MSTTCYTCLSTEIILCRKCRRRHCRRCKNEHERRETFESVIVDEKSGKVLNKGLREHPSICEAVPKENEGLCSQPA